MLVRGSRGTLFTCFQIEIEKSLKDFGVPVGFTLASDKIHGTRGEIKVKVTSEKSMKRGQFSKLNESSKKSGLKPIVPKVFSIDSKTFKPCASKIRR